MTRTRPAAIILLLVLATLVPSRAGAQKVDVRAISFGIGGGWSVPVRQARDFYQPGFVGEAYMRFDFGKHPLALRADLSYQNFPLRSAVIPPQASPPGGTGSLIGGLGQVQWYLGPGNVRPYLLAGAGVYSVRSEFDDPALASRADTHLGARGGAGVLLTFGNLLVYAESSLDHVFGGGGASGNDPIDVVPVAVGVNF